MAKPLYPVQVEINDKSIAQLTDSLKSTYKDVVQEIAGASDFSVKRRKEMLGKIEGMLENAGVNMQEFLEKEVPAYYQAGTVSATNQLNNIGADVPISQSFSVIDKKAVAALVDDTARAFGESLSGIQRSANLLLGKATRDMITQQIAKGITMGEALDTVKNNLKQRLQDEGLSALIDKGGRKWDLDTYAEMLFRTKAVEARNRGMVNRVAENGYDLVQVSAHSGSCELCAVWEGQILSVTGETAGYDTVADAEADGLFHPNCRHAINVVVPGLAKLTEAYGEGDDVVSYEVKGNTYTAGATVINPLAMWMDRTIIEEAKAWDTVFRKEVAGAVGDTFDFTFGPVKEAQRSAQKVLQDYGGKIYEMKDINRSAVFVDKWEDAKDVQTRIARNFEIGKKADGKPTIKDNSDAKTYKMIMVNVRTPYGGLAEIQITTPEMWEAKHGGGGDALYNKWRGLIGEGQLEKAKEYEQKMFELYDAADKAWKERVSS